MKRSNMKRSTKPMRASRSASTAAERAHMGRVAALGCILCSECLGYQDTPAIVHHLRTGQGKMRASHYDTMPLCPIHHQNSGYGVHDMGRKQFAEMYGMSELELLAATKERLGLV
jgi:hypothetical protein